MLVQLKVPVLALAAVALSGCTTVQMPEVSLSHPAHFDAERAAFPVRPSVLAAPASPVLSPPLPVEGHVSTPSTHVHGSAPSHSDHGILPAPADAVYACPMHPEVVSDRPGTCPKCGMDLVLQGEQP